MTEAAESLHRILMRKVKENWNMTFIFELIAEKKSLIGSIDVWNIELMVTKYQNQTGGQFLVTVSI